MFLWEWFCSRIETLHILAWIVFKSHSSQLLHLTWAVYEIMLEIFSYIRSFSSLRFATSPRKWPTRPACFWTTRTIQTLRSISKKWRNSGATEQTLWPTLLTRALTDWSSSRLQVCFRWEILLLSPVRWLSFCSFHAMTSSVVYDSTHVRQNEIYLFNTCMVVLCITSQLLLFRS